MLLLKETYNGYKFILRNCSKFAFIQKHLQFKDYIRHNPPQKNQI
jgi:hypothetical protein